MTSSRRFTVPTLAVALATASLALPGAALARGGGGGGGGGGSGGGGGTPAPAPAPAPDSTPAFTCDFSLDGVQADGSTIFTNQANLGGCVTARVSGTSLTLYRATDAPGWTHIVTSNGGGTNSRIALTFTQTGTKNTVEVRIEFGKTVIK
jgi:hypothetical protein